MLKRFLFLLLIAAAFTAFVVPVTDAQGHRRRTITKKARPHTSPTPHTTTPTPPGGSGVVIYADSDTVMSCDYFAAPFGSGPFDGKPGNDGAFWTPWDLQTALGKVAELNGKALCLEFGVYQGKFRSTLVNATVKGVRSLGGVDGVWASTTGRDGAMPRIDGNFATTLSAAMTSGQTSFSVVDGSAIYAGSNVEVWIDNEIITVEGKSGNNITTCLRNAQGSVGGAAAHAAGATVRLIGGKQLEVLGSTTKYIGIEITNSNTERGSGVPVFEKFRGHGIFNNGSGNSFINLVLHDNVDGIFSGSSGANTLISGCLIYNNGLDHAADYLNSEPIGYGMYLENPTGYCRVYDTIVLNNYVGGAQYYGRTAAFVGGDTQNSVFANNGSPINGHGPGLIFGTNQVLVPTGTVNASHFYHPFTASNGGGATLGYGAGMTQAVFTNNYLTGGGTLLELTPETAQATVTGNRFYCGTNSVNVLASQRGSSYVLSGNSYYNTSAGLDKFGNTTLHTNQTFTEWKASTGYDAGSTMMPIALPTTVIIKPNAEETGRSHIIIHGPSGPTLVGIDLATTGLPSGHRFVIRNVLWANDKPHNIVYGTYNGGTQMVTIPLNVPSSTDVPTPFGGAVTPATTVPQFGVFVLIDAGIAS